jgi:serine O-acetyltransferase
MDINEILQEAVGALSHHTPEEDNMLPEGQAPLPSVESVTRIVELVRQSLFSDFFYRRQPRQELRAYYIGECVEELYSLLRVQVARGYQFCHCMDEDEARLRADDVARQFISNLPEVKRLLLTDIQAMYHGDPAATHYGEVVFCYPVINAMIHYRTAHQLWRLEVPVLPRIITEQAHSQTGIDIHPGAQIGEFFSIDHGTGVVIGETAVIGHHVSLYQGVTLGAKSFRKDDEGNLLNIPRHPILEDHVTVYSNASILGRITIGHHSVIGGNVWLTHGVPPHSHIVQGKAQDGDFQDGLGI